MMEDELQKMNVAMVDLKGDLEDKFARLMETMSHHDNGGTSGSRESRMTEGNPSHATGYRGDQENPFATNPVPAKNVKLHCGEPICFRQRPTIDRESTVGNGASQRLP